MDKILAPLQTPANEQAKAILGAVLAFLISLLGGLTAHGNLAVVMITALITGLGTYLGVYHMSNAEPPGA